MGTKWGINRTVAQVHALLYLAAKPMPADEISTSAFCGAVECEHQFAGSCRVGNCACGACAGRPARSLRNVEGCLGDFPDCGQERKKREIDPTLRVLAECVQEVKSGQGDAHSKERLEAMLEFLVAMSGLFEEILRMPTGALKSVVKLRGKVITLLGTGNKKAG